MWGPANPSFGMISTVHWKQICAIMVDQGWSTLIISWSCLINPLVVTHPTTKIHMLNRSTLTKRKNDQGWSITIKYDQPWSIIIAQMCCQCRFVELYSSLVIWYSRCPTKTRIGWALPPNPSFDMTTRKIFRTPLAWRSSLILKARHFAESNQVLSIWLLHHH